MKRKARWIWSLLGLGTLAALTGCARSAPTRFYRLTPLEDGGRSRVRAPAETRRTLQVEEVALPRWLERGTVATASEGSETAFSEFHRWGGPLDRLMADALLVTLSQGLPAFNVVGRRMDHDLEPDLVLRVEVMDLSGTLGGEAVLEARWSLRRVSDGEMLSFRVFEGGTKVGEDDPGEIVRAVNRLWDEMSRDMMDRMMEDLSARDRVRE